MQSKPRPLVVGNWKMNGLRMALMEVHNLNNTVRSSRELSTVDIMLCPPTTLLMKISDELENKTISLGAQDCHISASGAHTGDISAEMLADAGASAVILGHSERRCDHSETDEIVLSKQKSVHRAGLIGIICIGETLGHRQAGLTSKVVERQLENSISSQSTSYNTIVAYEPVWAIGTGITPSLEEISKTHALIRTHLTQRFCEDGSRFRILYGGSVKPQNATDLMGVANVDGALVGGASLKSIDFLRIISACIK